MPCEISIAADRIPDPEQVIALYREAGWIAPDAGTEFVPAMLKNSFLIAAAYDGGRLVGMMRALSDGVSDAYILDLIVTREYRKHGLGRQILDTLTGALKSRGIDWIVCIGAPGTETFYQKTEAAVMTGYTPYRFN